MSRSVYVRILPSKDRGFSATWNKRHFYKPYSTTIPHCFLPCVPIKAYTCAYVPSPCHVSTCLQWLPYMTSSYSAPIRRSEVNRMENTAEQSRLTADKCSQSVTTFSPHLFAVAISLPKHSGSGILAPLIKVSRITKDDFVSWCIDGHTGRMNGKTNPTTGT